MVCGQSQGTIDQKRDTTDGKSNAVSITLWKALEVQVIPVGPPKPEAEGLRDGSFPILPSYGMVTCCK